MSRRWGDDYDDPFCVYVFHVNSTAEGALKVSNVDITASAADLAQKLEEQHGLPARTEGITTRLFRYLSNDEFDRLVDRKADSEGPMLTKIGDPACRIHWNNDILNQYYHKGKCPLSPLSHGCVLLYVQVPDGEDGEPKRTSEKYEPHVDNDLNFDRELLKPV